MSTRHLSTRSSSAPAAWACPRRCSWRRPGSSRWSSTSSPAPGQGSNKAAIGGIRATHSRRPRSASAWSRSGSSPPGRRATATTSSGPGRLRLRRLPGDGRAGAEGPPQGAAARRPQHPVARTRRDARPRARAEPRRPARRDLFAGGRVGVAPDHVPRVLQAGGGASARSSGSRSASPASCGGVGWWWACGPTTAGTPPRPSSTPAAPGPAVADMAGLDAPVVPDSHEAGITEPVAPFLDADGRRHPACPGFDATTTSTSTSPAASSSASPRTRRSWGRTAGRRRPSCR